MVIVDPLVIVTLLVTSLVLASAGAGGFLSLVLHLMSRATVQVPVAQISDQRSA